MDVIKVADHIIDIGPEGGKNGGEILCTGTPEQIAKNKKSFTAKFLKEELSNQNIWVLNVISAVNYQLQFQVENMKQPRQ